MDWPGQYIHRNTICTVSPHAAGGDGVIGISWGVESNSLSWPAANRAIYVPFTLEGPFYLQRFFWVNGATANGNMDAGVFTNEAAGNTGTKIASTGATAQSGTSVVQSAAPSAGAILLLPGSYYMALASSSGTATVCGWNITTVYIQHSGCAQQATAEPLPATATFASVANNFLPLFGISQMTVV